MFGKFLSAFIQLSIQAPDFAAFSMQESIEYVVYTYWFIIFPVLAIILFFVIRNRMKKTKNEEL